METKDIVQAIENLGLSAYEAKAYYALLTKSPLTGYQLSKISGVPRSRIYETVEKLSAKGLVLSQEGDTTLLIPVSLESFLERKERESLRNIGLLKEILPQLEKPAEVQGIWTIPGRDQILEAIKQLLSIAKDHIYLVSFDSDILVFKDDLSAAEKRGISVFGVYCGDRRFEFERLEPHQGQACSSCRDIALSIDSNQALVGCTFPPERARAAVTKNPGIIHVAEDYIKHEILLSRLFGGLGEAPGTEWNRLYREILEDLP